MSVWDETLKTDAKLQGIAECDVCKMEHLVMSIPFFTLRPNIQPAFDPCLSAEMMVHYCRNGVIGPFSRIRLRVIE